MQLLRIANQIAEDEGLKYLGRHSETAVPFCLTAPCLLCLFQGDTFRAEGCCGQPRADPVPISWSVECPGKRDCGLHEFGSPTTFKWQLL